MEDKKLAELHELLVSVKTSQTDINRRIGSLEKKLEDDYVTTDQISVLAYKVDRNTSSREWVIRIVMTAVVGAVLAGVIVKAVPAI